jgi:glycosyltransferase involved in cell wall biosynthesis
LNHRPRVSVVVPFRDAEPWIDEALASLAAQTMENFEVVLIDDSSRDQSRRLALTWCDRDLRFRVVTNAGSGLVDALNTGIWEARGNWIARFDADDICLPGRLAAQLALAEETGERSVISCRIKSFPEENVSEGYRKYEDWINSLTGHDEIEREIFVESPIPHPTALYGRDAVLSEGGYLDSDLPEDYELWLRLWSRGFRFARVPEVLVRWREREERYSRTSPVYSLTRFYRLKASYIGFAPAIRDRRVLIAGSGQTARRFAACIMKGGFEIGAFIDPSSCSGRTLKGVPVVGPSGIQEFPGWPVLVASRAPGAREDICTFLESQGMKNWDDFIVCA